MGVAAEAIDRALLIVDELLSNAVEHGVVHRQSFDPLVIRAEVSGTDLVIEFQDPEVPSGTVAWLKRALESGGNAVPPIENERGRGMFLVADALRDVHVEPTGGGGMRITGRMPGALA